MQHNLTTPKSRQPNTTTAAAAAAATITTTQPYLEKLGLDSTATAAQIKKTYRKLALKNHPDKGGDQDLFLSLTEAYEVSYSN